MASRSRRRRWPLVVAAVVVVVVGAALIVRAVAFRDESRAVGVDEAVEAYHASTTTVAPTTVAPTTVAPTTVAPTTVAPTTTVVPAATTPAPGVYRYATTGKESVDVLNGADHGYPQETTITVSPDGCGVLLRWDALRERRDEWRLCATTEGIELQPAGLQYHEFFSQPDSEAVTCSSPTLLVPASADAVPPVAGTSCTLGEDAWSPVWTVLERTQRTVEGIAVDVVHVRMTVDDTDEYGEQTVVDWYLDAHGLPLEASSTKDSRSPSPIGAVTYHEEYHLVLESLTPLG